MAPDSALLIVDVQNDFCPGGALPVPEGDQVVAPLNEYVDFFRSAGATIYASRDWHPARTRHFRESGGPWPPHCIQGTTGAEFHPDLRLPADTVIMTKGTDPEDHGYSAFEGTDPAGRSLASLLRMDGVERIFIGGLTTDYCVRTSTLDARRNGFNVVLLLDAMKGIDVKSGDVARALDEMLRAGATAATLGTITQVYGRA